MTTAPLPPDPRPSLDEPLEALLADLARRLAPLSRLDTRAIVVVALSAHGTAAASVRSLDGAAERVTVGGHARRWELGLRPPFFLEGDPTRRLGTLVHELLHLDPDRPGALLDENRHRNRPHEAHEREAQALAERWLADAPLSRLAPLGHHGEALLRQWRHRPVPETASRVFTDADVFQGPIFVSTPKERRTVWW